MVVVTGIRKSPIGRQRPPELTGRFSGSLAVCSPLRSAGIVVSQHFQCSDQFVDFLVLDLDLQGQRITVGQNPAQNGPQHYLFGEGVAEHQAVDPPKYRLLARAARALQFLQQLIELPVVAALADQHATGTTELLSGLVGDRIGPENTSVVRGWVSRSWSLYFPARPGAMRVIAHSPVRALMAAGSLCR